MWTRALIIKSRLHLGCCFYRIAEFYSKRLERAPLVSWSRALPEYGMVGEDLYFKMTTASSQIVYISMREDNSPGQGVSSMSSSQDHWQPNLGGVKKGLLVKHTFLGPTPNLLNQNFWVWNSGTCILSKQPGGSCGHHSVRSLASGQSHWVGSHHGYGWLEWCQFVYYMHK